VEVSAEKLALLARRARQTPGRDDALTCEPIAIVAMACRFPGGNHSPDTFWRNLLDGQDAITEVPANRWDAAALHDPDPEAPGRINTRYGGFIDRVDEFDAAFFGISPREASRMDPQQRVMLELCHEAFERGALDPRALAGSPTGVFVGASADDYGHLSTADLDTITAHTGSGTALSIIANRLSYVFDLRGPSLTIDTACSSALVALHTAVRALRAGECNLACAGGVGLILSPRASIAFSSAGMLAPDGRCKTFDSRADGYVRGEGAGLVVLKRLGDAIADGDPVVAVIRGTAVNQDGRTSVLTAPNGRLQADVIRAALANARLPADRVGYVEAHGTGTSLGDPIEVEALREVFGKSACTLGSVKTNIGHLEAAAGIAGFIKASLSVQRGVIPRHLHFETLNPAITLGAGLRIATETTPWSDADARRCAGVSSFGFGGTNAHVIVEQAPPSVPRRPDTRAQLVVVSASRPDAAQARARAMAAWMEDASPAATRATPSTAAAATSDAATAVATSEQSEALVDLAYSAACGQRPRSHRAYCVAATPDGLDAALRRVEPTEAPDAPPELVFVFTGQGTQWAGMGAALLDEEPTFAETIAEISAIAGVDIAERLRAADAGTLAKTEALQPALFALQVGLTRLLSRWGVTPAAVIGHSVGEVAAAWASGALELADATRLIVARGAALEHARGAMAAVDADAAWVRAQLEAGPNSDTAEAAPDPAKQTGEDSEAAAANSEPHPLGATLDPTKQTRDEEDRSKQRLDNGDAEATISEPRQQRLDNREAAATMSDPQQVAVAVHNGPNQTVIAGDAAAVAALSERWQAEGRRVRVVNDTYAFHGPALGPCSLETLHAPAAAPTIPFYSTVTGARDAPDEGYWVRNATQPVLHLEAVQAATTDGFCTFVEIGPHPALLKAIAEIAPEADTIATLRRSRGGRRAVLDTLGELYLRGVEPRWRKLFASKRNRVPLPAHPFERRRHWIARVAARPSGHPLFGEAIATPLARAHHRVTLAPDQPDWLADHVIHERVLVPAVALFEMMRHATGGPIEDVRIETPLVLDGPREVHTIVRDDGTVEVLGRVGDHWSTHATARSTGHPTPRAATPPTPTSHVATPSTSTSDAATARALVGRSLDEARDACPTPADPADHYARMRALGYGHGPSLRAIEALWVGDGEALGRVRAPKGPFAVHPAALEGALQVALAAAEADAVYVPIAAERVQLDYTGDSLFAHARLVSRTDAQACFDFSLYAPDGAPVGHVRGLTAKIARSFDRPAKTVGLATVELRDLDDDAPALPEGIRVVGPMAAALGRPGAGDAIQEARGEDHERPGAANPERAAGVLRDGADVLIAGATPQRALATAQACLRGRGRVWFVVGEEPESAAVSGLARAFALEHPDRFAGLLEVHGARADLHARIRGHEAVINGTGRPRRWAIVPLAAPANESNAARIRSDATYLITGGLGAIGAAIASWLVERGARDIVLLSRKASADHPTVQELTDRGADVRVIAADVTDTDAVHAAMAGRTVGGIVHAAGIATDAMLETLDRDALSRTLAPKLDGGAVIAELAHAHRPDFVAFCGSLTSLTGAPGQAAYCAANAALDAHARKLRQSGINATSIAFGPWAEGGMASGSLDRFRGAGLAPMTPEEALDAFGRAIEADQPLVVVAHADWPALAARLSTYGHCPSALADHHRAAPAPAIDLSGPPARLALRLERYLIVALGEVLDMPADEVVAPNAGFFELGLDSMLAVELTRRLEAALGRSIDSSAVFDHASPAALARHLAGVDASPPAPAAARSGAAASTASVDDLLAEVEDLDDAEVDAILEGGE